MKKMFEIKDLKFIRSPKHPGAIFIKVLHSDYNDFLCKGYARDSDIDTVAVAR
jgi:hypothetical protein